MPDHLEHFRIHDLVLVLVDVVVHLHLEHVHHLEVVPNPLVLHRDLVPDHHLDVVMPSPISCSTAMIVMLM